MAKSVRIFVLYSLKLGFSSLESCVIVFRGAYRKLINTWAVVPRACIYLKRRRDRRLFRGEWEIRYQLGYKKHLVSPDLVTFVSLSAYVFGWTSYLSGFILWRALAFFYSYGALLWSNWLRPRLLRNLFLPLRQDKIWLLCSIVSAKIKPVFARVDAVWRVFSLRIFGRSINWLEFRFLVNLVDWEGTSSLSGELRKMLALNF